jgi:hypothetical protein
MLRCCATRCNRRGRAQLKQQLLARHALFMLSAVIESPHAGVQANATRSPYRGSSAFLPRQQRVLTVAVARRIRVVAAGLGIDASVAF